MATSCRMDTNCRQERESILCYIFSFIMILMWGSLVILVWNSEEYLSVEKCLDCKTKQSLFCSKFCGEEGKKLCKHNIWGASSEAVSRYLQLYQLRVQLTGSLLAPWISYSLSFLPSFPKILAQKRDSLQSKQCLELIYMTFPVSHNLIFVFEKLSEQLLLRQFFKNKCMILQPLKCLDRCINADRLP